MGASTARASETTDQNAMVTERANLKSLKVTINGISIREQTIVDLQINYKKNMKDGSITFVDAENVGELGNFTEGIIEITYVDGMGNQYGDVFAICDSDGARSKKNAINNTLSFESVAIHKMKMTYLSLGFKDASLSDVIKKVCDLVDISLTIVDSSEPYMFEGLVIPKSICFYDWLITKLDISNKIMYATKAGMVIIDKDLLDFKNLPDTTEHDFVQGADPENPYHNILEFHGKTASKATLLTAPPSETEYIKDNVLSLQTTKVSIDTASATQAMNGSYGKDGKTIGNGTIFYGSKTTSSIGHNLKQGIDKDYRDVINESQGIYMIVQGLNLQRMYKKVNLVFERTPTINSGHRDEIFSGSFVIVECKDKITGGVFLQKLTLQRSDYGAGDQNVQ